MTVNKQTISGSYAYDMAFELIDYCGDIARNSKGASRGYSPNFSPNNIKRLIISPDCIEVHYHLPIEMVKEWI